MRKKERRRKGKDEKGEGMGEGKGNKEIGEDKGAKREKGKMMCCG